MIVEAYAGTVRKPSLHLFLGIERSIVLGISKIDDYLHE